MTMGISFLYSECSNTRLEKGICYVSPSMLLLKSNPNCSCPGYRVDHHSKYCRNYRFHWNRDRARDRAARHTLVRLALESIRLPMPWLDQEYMLNPSFHNIRRGQR